MSNVSPVSHQTIRLGKGKHAGPADGACVMELASMLAAEPFTDHPECVCPIIGGFLRAYNDSIDDERRQDLYAYAATVVGTRGDVDVEAARMHRLRQWTAERRRHRPLQLASACLRSFAHRELPTAEAAGTLAMRTIRRHTAASHRQVLALIDELAAIGPAPLVPVAPAADQTSVTERVLAAAS